MDDDYYRRQMDQRYGAVGYQGGRYVEPPMGYSTNREYPGTVRQNELEYPYYPNTSIVEFQQKEEEPQPDTVYAKRFYMPGQKPEEEKEGYVQVPISEYRMLTGQMSTEEMQTKEMPTSQYRYPRGEYYDESRRDGDRYYRDRPHSGVGFYLGSGKERFPPTIPGRTESVEKPGFQTGGDLRTATCHCHNPYHQHSTLP